METTVANLTVSELEQVISNVFDKKFAEIMDPDFGLELREDFVERLLRQSRDFKEGKLATIGLDELLDNLGIDKSEIEDEENVPAGVY